MTNVSCGVYFKDNLSGSTIKSKNTNLTVEAGKIKVINVNFE